MNIESIREIFRSSKYYYGRMISGNKTLPKGQIGVFNANLITKTHGKVWFGDINLTKDEKILKNIAGQIGEPLYVLSEKDCRFGTENDPIETLISKSKAKYENN